MRKKMPQYIISTALIRSLRSYNTASLMADLKAAFVVSLVALPLSMALAIAVGLPPQHGLYTAIVAGIVAPIFGGSKFQVSGPTAAFIVILAPIVSELGLRGLIWCQILAGLFLIILGLTKTGRLVNYIPYPVTTGFTAGIAIVIATLSLKDLFGLDIGAMPDSYIQKVASLLAHIGSFKLPEFIISMLTLALIVYGGRLTKLVPSPIIAVGGATLAAIAFHKFGYADIITISDKFSYTDMLGNIVHGIPPYPPMLHIPGNDPSGLLDLPTLKELKALLSPALIIAVLAALESLLSATVADSMTGKKHDPNAELERHRPGKYFHRAILRHTCNRRYSAHCNKHQCWCKITFGLRIPRYLCAAIYGQPVEICQHGANGISCGVAVHHSLQNVARASGHLGSQERPEG
jgi:SulP family sulfate permease